MRNGWVDISEGEKITIQKIRQKERCIYIQQRLRNSWWKKQTNLNLLRIWYTLTNMAESRNLENPRKKQRPKGTLKF